MLVDTHLFAWNPVLWNWPELPDDIRTLAKRGHLDTDWSAGRTRNLEPGSRAYLVRLGVPPKGLFGAGTVMTAPVERRHWRKDKAAAGTTTGYVMLRLDALFELGGCRAEQNHCHRQTHSQFADEMLQRLIDGAGNRLLRVDIGTLVEGGQHLAVEAHRAAVTVALHDLDA